MAGKSVSSAIRAEDSGARTSGATLYARIGSRMLRVTWSNELRSFVSAVYGIVNVDPNTTFRGAQRDNRHAGRFASYSTASHPYRPLAGDYDGILAFVAGHWTMQPENADKAHRPFVIATRKALIAWAAER